MQAAERVDATTVKVTVRGRDPFADAERLTALDDVAREVYRALARMRARLARELGVPAFRILSNRHLLELAEAKPFDETALRSLRGMGPLLVRAYGAEILAVVRETAGIR